LILVTLQRYAQQLAPGYERRFGRKAVAGRPLLRNEVQIQIKPEFLLNVSAQVTRALTRAGARQSHERVLSEKSLFTSVIVRLTLSGAKRMPNDLCIFFDSAMLFFVNFTSVSSPKLGKKAFMRLP